MKKLIAIILLLLSIKTTIAQTDESIIREILYELFEPSQDTILFNSTAYKTFFEYDSISFTKETSLNVSKDIISELQNNTKPDNYTCNWNQQLLNKPDTILNDIEAVLSKNSFFKLLSEKEIKELLKKKGQRKYVYSITKILFDNSHKNAIFHFMVTNRPGQFFLETILVKNIFGKWVIVERFDFVMT